ncbi:MAG TPA: hypothetical protein VG733_09410 [Chthoniobacteraceae bacterium]|nr:hypothetical protein [Chthoniobacteraceae bacterium]
MRVFTHSEPGGKIENEDYLIANPHPGFPLGYVCLLADGQGGQSNGALAARTACETAWQLSSQRSFEGLLEANAWQMILADTDVAVAATGGYTTLIGFAIRENYLCGASCGDAKLFLSDGAGGIVEPTSKQRKNPPVGSGEAAFEGFYARLQTRNRLLAVSDGVWKYCGHEALREAFQLGDFSNAAGFLRDAVSKTGAALPDDFSLVAVDII